MDKRVISLVLAIVALIGMVAVASPFTSGSPLMEVYLSPQYNSVVIGQSFSVNIIIANVPTPGLYSYELKLYYDSTVLQGVSAQIPVGHFLTPLKPSNIFIVDPGTVRQASGYVSFALTLLGNELGKTGSGVLATVTFRGLAAGSSPLQFTSADVILVDATGNQIASSQYQLRSGNVDVASGPSLMRVSVSPQYSSVAVGQSFSVNINIGQVPSPGIYSYQFNLYYDRTVLQGVSAQIPVGHFLTPLKPSNIFIVDPGTINQVQGRVSFALTLLSNEPGKTGDGVLTSVQFTGLVAGSSLLELRDVVLVDATGNQIASSQYGVISGSVNVSPSGSLMKVYLSPQYNSLVIGQSFSVNISIGCVPLPGLYSYELKLYYDRMVLQCVNAYIPSDHFLRPITPGKIFIVDSGTINQGQGYVSFALTLLAPELGKTGDGVLATVQFKGLTAGSSPLELRDLILVDSNGNQIAPSQYQVSSGSASVLSGPSLMQVSVSPQYNSVNVGQSFSVNVNIADVPSPGLYSYEFKLYYDKAVLQGVSAQIPVGHFLTPVKPSNIFIVDPGTVRQASGYVSFALTLLGDDPGKTGNGILAAIIFTALAPGDAVISISGYSLSDPVFLDPNSVAYPRSSYSLISGYVHIQVAEDHPPICVARIQKNNIEISRIGVGEFFDIDVSQSTDDERVAQVRFSSDDVQDGMPTGRWTDWFDWEASFQDWNALTRIKRWSFATPGYKEVWAEAKDYAGQTNLCSDIVFASAPALPVITSGLVITPMKDFYAVGDSLETQFTIKNVGNVPITLDVLTVGGRLNGFIPPEGAPDFTFQYVSLQTGESYEYHGSLTLTQMGNYRFFVAYRIDNPTPEEKKLLDKNNWNTCVELGEGLTQTNRVKNIIVFEEGIVPEEVSQLTDKIDRLKQKAITIPPDLRDPNSFDLKVAAVFAEVTDFLSYVEYSKLYYEWYQTSVDYECLRFASILKAESALEDGDIEGAKEYLQRSYKLGELSCQSYTAALEVFDANLATAERWAGRVSWLTQNLLGIGLSIINPTLGTVASYAFIGLDYAMDRYLLHVSADKAQKELATRLVLETLVRFVKFEDLGGRTIENYMNNRVGALTFPILQKLFSKESTQFLVSKAVKEAASSLSGDLAILFAEKTDEITTRILEELSKGIAYIKEKGNSPIELRIYDSEGRIAGLVDGSVKHGIPRSVYFNETITIFFPMDTYQFEVAGTQEGAYGLEISLFEDGNSTIFAADNIDTSPNTVHKYAIDWDALSLGEESVTVQVDSDGDGAFELTFTSDNELTTSEFIPEFPSIPIMLSFTMATLLAVTVLRRKKRLNVGF